MRSKGKSYPCGCAMIVRKNEIIYRYCREHSAIFRKVAANQLANPSFPIGVVYPSLFREQS